MATKTAMHHPKKAGQESQFFPYSAQITDIVDESGNDTLIAESAAAYQPDRGGAPGVFQTEAPVGDQILLPSWRSECQSGQIVILTLGDWRKRFVISDVLPIGSGPEKTLLMVTPDQRGS